MTRILISIRTRSRALLRSRGEDRGASVVEYALLLAFIVTVCIIAVTVLGGSASKVYSSAVPFER
jgi:Flp pilus assembly pilin Flp